MQAQSINEKKVAEKSTIDYLSGVLRSFILLSWMEAILSILKYPGDWKSGNFVLLPMVLF
jgi:hypothetical protein